MANYTEKYNLEKPLEEEFYDVNVFNANADKIDTALQGKADIDLSNVENSVFQSKAEEAGVGGASDASELTGTVPIDHGGTGATTAASALNNLGITYGTTDLTAGTSSLTTGSLYLVYET